MTRSLIDWLIYYENLHPVGIDMGLSRIAVVWKHLCETYHIEKIAKKKVITVSGTNGKGSTCQMLSLLLQAKSSRVGVYSSPHIHRFNERIRINDKAVDDEIIIRAFEAIEVARHEITLSHFEATTLAGLLVFAWQAVDFAVLEVGLGGRLDAINIIDADAAIMSTVSLDHQAFLGHDLSQIALEKAGIFRPNCPAVYAQTTHYNSVFEYARCYSIPLLINGIDYQQNGRTVIISGQHYKLPTSLLIWGEHQLQNAAATIVLLKKLALLPKDYKQRLARFSLLGRLQVIAKMPTVIVDVAHNEEAVTALVNYIKAQHHQGKVYAVIGMLDDKNHKAILSLFDGVFSGLFFGDTWGERGFSGQSLKDINSFLSRTPSFTFPTLSQALISAKQQSDKNDVIYAFGSFLVVEALTTAQ
ncbi:MAG: bifunctional folylpolyglutamate synthase/dihydrofolate synthase [Ostreibacterium sp.]